MTNTSSEARRSSFTHGDSPSSTPRRDDGVPPAPATAKHSKRATIVSFVITQLMLILDMTIIAIALPSMQSSLGMSDVQRPWVVTAYSLAYGGLVLFGGRLCSVIGIRRSYLLGLTFFAAASFMAGIAPSFAVMVTARTLQGAGAALLAPTVVALVNRTFTEARERRQAFAILGATGGVGAAVGLLLGGGLTDSFGWRWTLYINIVIAALALVIGRPGLPEHERDRKGQTITSDLLGLVMGCSSVFALVFGLDQAQHHTWSAASTIAWLAVGFVLLTGFILRERTARDAVLPLAIVTSPVRFSSYGTLFMASAAQMGMVVYITYYFQNHFEYSPTRTGVAFLPMVAAIIVTATTAAPSLVSRLGARFVFPLGLAVEACSLFILSNVTTGSTYPQVALPGLIVFGVGIGLCLPVTFNLGTRGVPQENAGLASAMLNTSQQIGSSFGVALLATYATQHATAYASEHTDRFRATITEALMRAQATPDSAQGRRIIAEYRAIFTDEATVNAYAGGFTLMCVLLCLASLLLLLGAAWYTRRGRRTGAPGDPTGSVDPGEAGAASVAGAASDSEDPKAADDLKAPEDSSETGGLSGGGDSRDVADLSASEDLSETVAAGEARAAGGAEPASSSGDPGDASAR